MYLSPTLLAPGHSLDGFVSRSPEQMSWLVDHARPASASGTAKTMVVTPRGSDQVVAYYAWAMASVAIADLPARGAHGVGRYPQPFALLARLAVHRDHEGRGLGHGLLKDVVLRTVELGSAIGCRGLLVHAEGEEARAFHLHALPGLDSSPTSPLHLVALLKDLRRNLG